MNVNIEVGDPATFAVRMRVAPIAGANAYGGCVQLAVGGHWYGDTCNQDIINAEIGAISDLLSGEFDPAIAVILWSLPAEVALAAVYSSTYSRTFVKNYSLPPDLSPFVQAFHFGPHGRGLGNTIIIIIPRNDQLRICAGNGIRAHPDCPTQLSDIREVICDKSTVANICKDAISRLPPIPGVRFTWST